MATDKSELREWRLSIIADLVWKVLPEQERAKSWRDVAVRAVYEYERNIKDYADRDDFVLQSDTFIAEQYICNHRSEIRSHLELQGRYIGYMPGRGEPGIFRVSNDLQLSRFLTLQEGRMSGMVDAYNGRMETVRKQKPKLMEDINLFQTAPRITVKHRN